MSSDRREVSAVDTALLLTQISLRSFGRSRRENLKTWVNSFVRASMSGCAIRRRRAKKKSKGKRKEKLIRQVRVRTREHVHRLHRLRRFLRLISHNQLLHRNAVAPYTHEALLWCIAERILAVLSIERCIAERVEEFPGAEIVQSIDCRISWRVNLAISYTRTGG